MHSNSTFRLCALSGHTEIWRFWNISCTWGCLYHIIWAPCSVSLVLNSSEFEGPLFKSAFLDEDSLLSCMLPSSSCSSVLSSLRSVSRLFPTDIRVGVSHLANWWPISDWPEPWGNNLSIWSALEGLLLRSCSGSRESTVESSTSAITNFVSVENLDFQAHKHVRTNTPVELSKDMLLAATHHLIYPIKLQINPKALPLLGKAFICKLQWGLRWSDMSSSTPSLVYGTL